MTLADLLNVPVEFEFEGKTYKMRQPTLLECAEYQRWLEQEARASAARATEIPEEDREKLLRNVQRDIAAQIYAYGGEVCMTSLSTPQGAAQIMHIVMKDQDVTRRMADRMVQGRLEQMIGVINAARQSGDPEVKRQLGQLLKTLGLPENFLDTSSSDSATTP